MNRIALVPVFFAAALACAGCGQAESRPAAPVAARPQTGNTLAGKVTINQKQEMPEGSVFVYNDATGRPSASGRIRADGGYTIKNVPAGPVQIVVSRDPSMRPPPVPGMVGQTGPGPGGPGGVRPPIGPKGPPKPPAGPPDMPVGPGGPPVGGPGPGGPGGPGGPPQRPGGVTLSPEVAKLLDAVDQKYGSLMAPGKVTFTVAPGENTFDIDLTTP